MKKAMVLLWMATLGSAANAEVLMRYFHGATFGPSIMEDTIEVTADGKVIDYVYDYHTSKTIPKELAQLSAGAVEALKNKLTWVDASAGLEDAQPGMDPCADAPEVRLDVWLKGVETGVYKQSACHDFKLKNNSAEQLVQLAKTLFSLTY